ncbi:MAG: hypothetical protein WAL40_09905 [Rhodoplanes sp.]|jgi:hypothetical protein
MKMLPIREDTKARVTAIVWEWKQPARNQDRRDGIRVHQRTILLWRGGIYSMLPASNFGIDEHRSKMAVAQSFGQRVDSVGQINVPLLDRDISSDVATIHAG